MDVNSTAHVSNKETGNMTSINQLKLPCGASDEPT